MFYFEKSFGLFVGKLEDNKFHKHYALQLSVSSHSNMMLSVNAETDILGKAFFLNSKTEHRLFSKNNQLSILIDPLSAIGYQLKSKLGNSNYSTNIDSLSNELIEILDKFETEIIPFETLCHLVSQTLTEYKCTCELENHLDDDRIMKAIELMDKHFEKVLSLEEVAQYCFLSPTRFLHLFKEKTNLNFRRYQLWNKVVKSLPYLAKNSITDTAYTFGFSDNSHYTRTFVETFGFSPKFFVPKK
jgi:AraC-like DNA-binding protein